jgi:hypothetical protein
VEHRNSADSAASGGLLRMGDEAPREWEATPPRSISPASKRHQPFPSVERPRSGNSPCSHVTATKSNISHSDGRYRDAMATPQCRPRIDLLLRRWMPALFDLAAWKLEAKGQSRSMEGAVDVMGPWLELATAATSGGSPELHPNGSHSLQGSVRCTASNVACLLIGPPFSTCRSLPCHWPQIRCLRQACGADIPIPRHRWPHWEIHSSLVAFFLAHSPESSAAYWNDALNHGSAEGVHRLRRCPKLGEREGDGRKRARGWLALSCTSQRSVRLVHIDFADWIVSLGLQYHGP